MERFDEALDAFLRFDLRADGWVAYAVFIMSSGVAGLAIVLLDACSVMLKLVLQKEDFDPGHSYLGLTHGWRATPRNALVWMVASMIASGLGLMARVFQPTPLAAVLASLTWRTLLSQLRRLSAHHVEQRFEGE
jgi:hypothetical protein